MKTNALVRTPETIMGLGFMLIIFILFGCKSEPTKELQTNKVHPALNGTIIISGADALFPLMQIWAEEFSKENEDLTISVAKGGSDKGLDDLLTGQVNLAMVSRSLTPKEEANGLWYFTVSKEGVIPIINDKNPYLKEIQNQGIDRTTLIELFATNIPIQWGNILGVEKNDPVKIFIRSDISGTAEVWSDYLGVKQHDLIGMSLASENLLIEAVMHEPLSLSFCNAHSAYNLKKNRVRKGLSVIPIDLNNNGKIESKEQFYKELCMLQRAAYLGKYPSHLCRELYLVSIGKPSNPSIQEFIKWILTDGQKIAAKEGYAEIRHCRAKEIIELLKE